MVAPQAPDRGQLIWVDFSPHAGHEQAGRRPAIVISDAKFSAVTGFVIVCPITSQVKGYPFEVLLPPGLPVSGVILCDQERSFDCSARNAVDVGDAPSEVVDEVLARIRPLFED